MNEYNAAACDEERNNDASAFEAEEAKDEETDERLRATEMDKQRATNLNLQMRREVINYETMMGTPAMEMMSSRFQMRGFVEATYDDVRDELGVEREYAADIDSEAIDLLTKMGTGLILERMKAGGVVARSRGKEKVSYQDITSGDVLRGDITEAAGAKIKARHRERDEWRASWGTPVWGDEPKAEPEETEYDADALMLEERELVHDDDQIMEKLVQELQNGDESGEWEIVEGNPAWAEPPWSMKEVESEAREEEDGAGAREAES